MQPPRNRSKAAGFTLEEKQCVRIKVVMKCSHAQNAYSWYLPVHHYRLVHLIKEGNIRVPGQRSIINKPWYFFIQHYGEICVFTTHLLSCRNLCTWTCCRKCLNSCSSELTSRMWLGSLSISWVARGTDVRKDMRLDIRPSWKSCIM